MYPLFFLNIGAVHIAQMEKPLSRYGAVGQVIRCVGLLNVIRQTAAGSQHFTLWTKYDSRHRLFSKEAEIGCRQAGILLSSHPTDHQLQNLAWMSHVIRSRFLASGGIFFCATLVGTGSQTDRVFDKTDVVGFGLYVKERKSD